MSVNLVAFTNPLTHIIINSVTPPKTASFLQPTESQDWLSTTAATYHPATRKIYVTTTFNNLWAIDPVTRTAQKLSSDGWGSCTALVSDPTSGLLFAFCHKLYTVDPATGVYNDFLASNGLLDWWSKVTAATVLGPNLYCTTVTGGLYRISIQTRTAERISSEGWASCQALLPIAGKLYAFCTKFWIVNPDTGSSESFSEDGGLFGDIWGNVTGAAVVGTIIYAVTKAGKVWEVDTNTRIVKEAVGGWSLVICKALVALDGDIVGKL